MPAQILHVGAGVNCSHAPGKATPLSSFPRVKVSGRAVVTVRDQYSIAGCPLNSPCATGKWTSGAKKVRAGGFPVAIFSGQSTCLPTGNPMVPMSAQTRVRAT
jgi:uncharacterized Zn-binding protein involved in type VI secretion